MTFNLKANVATVQSSQVSRSSENTNTSQLTKYGQAGLIEQDSVAPEALLKDAFSL